MTLCAGFITNLTVSAVKFGLPINAGLCQPLRLNADKRGCSLHARLVRHGALVAVELLQPPRLACSTAQSTFLSGGNPFPTATLCEPDQLCTPRCHCDDPQALSDGDARDTSAQRAAAAPHGAPDPSTAARASQTQSPAAAPAAVQSPRTCRPELGTAWPHHSVDGTRGVFGEARGLPDVGNTRAAPTLAPSHTLWTPAETFSDAPDLTPQHAHPSSLQGDGAAPDGDALSEVSPLAAFGSPVHVHEQCLDEQPAAASAEDRTAGWWCERIHGAAAAPRGGGPQHSKPRRRGSAGLPHPTAAGAVGDKENDCTPSPPLQVGPIRAVTFCDYHPHCTKQDRTSSSAAW